MAYAARRNPNLSFYQKNYTIRHMPGLACAARENIVGNNMNPEKKLLELGLKLPSAPAAAGNYLPTVRTGNLLYCAGTLPVIDGQITHTGQAGREHTVQTAYEAARVCALVTLANIKLALGTLDRVGRVVFVNGFVNGVSGFADSPAVINGASDLFVAIFGEAGKHARAAVAVAGLPKNATVEIQVVVEVKDQP
jgi:enamine deaminase RidA (YjgF/YER057c/UK114 family)